MYTPILSTEVFVSRFPAMALSRRWLSRCTLFASFFLIALPAMAESVNYRVDISAPERLSTLLRNNLDIVTWSERGDVTEEQLRQLTRTAPEQIGSLLSTEGYFSPEVSIQSKRDGPIWVVALLVEPGPSTKVISIDFQITGAISSDPERKLRVERARKAFTLTEGAVFRQTEWSASKNDALHSLHRNRYASAHVIASRADINPDTQQAKLSVTIDSGPAFVFGDIQVKGLQRYAAELIENHSPINRGDPYDEEQLLKYQRRLLASGRFASAVVWADANPENASATPVFVSVVETVSRSVEIGVGYSTDRGPRFLLSYTDRNALDRALRFDTALKVDRLSTEVVSGLTLPRNAVGWRYGLEAKYDEQNIQGEQTINWSATGAHTFAVEEYESRQSLQSLAENRVLADGSEDNRKAVYLAQTWSWTRLNDILAPRSGYFAGLEIGAATEEIVSDRSFFRTVIKGSYFQPVSTFGTLAIRLEAGMVVADSRENIPSAYLFRTGGDTTVRGYAFESLGVAEGGAIVGGRYLAIGSVEYIQWITRQWGAAVFYDAGNAVDDKSAFRAAIGYGAGARWHSPLGALSLDVAYGEEVEEWRVHFNIGYVF